MEIREGLCFDDVLLVPKYSEVKSRAEVDLSVDLGKGFKFSNPITPANMRSICGHAMAECVAETGGLAIVHRFMSFEDQMDIATDIVTNNLGGHSCTRHIGFSVGVQKEDYKSVKQFYDAGVRIICVDIAHGDSRMGVEMCKYISESFPVMLLVAGNIATGEGARRLWEAGADVVKCGIGSGSLCSTRIETGNGVTQFTAIMDVDNERKKMRASGSHKWRQHKLAFISDGGIKNAGDCVKGLCFADMVMTGMLFAGTNETPGENIMIDGITYKEYNGSSTHKTSHIEGVKSAAPLKGSAKNVFTKLFDGITSGCSYQGVSNLTDLKKDPQFIRISNAGLIESHPHDIKIVS